jgi:tRNA G37 N-methylase Trm5
MRHKAHCDALKLAEDVLDESKRLILNTLAASEKTEVVVNIDGEYYYFWVELAKVFFRKIEVL